MFFIDIEDFKKYVPVNAGFDFNIMSIYLRDVDRTEIKPKLGATFLTALQTDFNAIQGTFEESSIAAPRKALIDLLRSFSANMALVKWLPIGQVTISQAGVQIVSSESNKTAFEWQLDKIEKECTQRAIGALEEALDYLSDNIENASFSDYKASNEYKALNSLFVNSARDFRQYCSMFDASYSNIKKLTSAIRKVEDFEIKALLLPDYFNELKTTLKNGDALGTNAQNIVDLLKPAIVNLAIARGISELSLTVNSNGLLTFDNTTSRGTLNSVKTAADGNLFRYQTTCEADGKAYLKIAGDYLAAHIEDYPTITNDDLYSGETVDLNATGTGSNKVYVGL
jgi:hypothetical protein